MSSYLVFLEPLAAEDIQNAIDYFDDKEIGLGVKFEEGLSDNISRLEEHPLYQVRYPGVHCLPLNTFPFMLHITP